MEQRARRALPVEVRQFRAKLASWRRSRGNRGRIPEAIWERAVLIARAYGIERVAQVLGLSREALERRVARRSLEPEERESHPVFVELNSHMPSAPRIPECVVELEDPSGARMVIRLAGEVPGDLVALAETFWGRRR